MFLRFLASECLRNILRGVIFNIPIAKVSLVAELDAFAAPYLRVARSNGLVPGKKLEVALASLHREGQHVA